MLGFDLQFFGGRGASSGFVIASGGKDKWSGNVGDVVADTLKDAIGTKGAAKSIGSAVVETNPNHSYDYSEFSKNCQRCVVAYELRRRGYDVEALPTYQGDTWKNVAYSHNGIYLGRWQGAFKGAKPVNVGAAGANAESKVMQNIERRMKSYGDGARAVVQIFYKKGGGHVFNVENQHGKTVYVEAQTGKMKNVAKTLTSVETQFVSLTRTDNLRISDRAKYFVKKK